MAEDQEPKGWWQTIPGILTATAGIITAVTGLIVALYQTKIFDTADKTQPGIQNTITTADLIAEKWSGEAKDANGTSFQVKININKPCILNEKCGSISVSHVPCYGNLFLQEIKQDVYEFRVDNFTNNSSSKCTPGAGEHLKLLPDGTLLYITTYDPKANGALKKVE